MGSSKNYCVIMGGGVGSRFWPMSRERKPKQFLDIFGTGRSLLRMTFDRFAQFIPAENILVVTNEAYKEQVLEQIPEMKPEQVLLEPMRRNTAPCIAFACYHIQAKCPEANIIVSPSDHLILNEARFAQDLKRCLDYVESHNELLTLGIRPSRPDTGYGYIQFKSEEGKAADDFHQVKTFTEKPNRELAEEFLRSGEFLWNSGMFVWNLPTIMSEFRSSLPELCDIMDAGTKDFATEREQSFIKEAFPRCQSISIDYGVMEKAEAVTVLPVDFGWADLGTWGSVYDLKEKDADDNVTLHGEAMYYNSSGNLVAVEGTDRLVVLEGINDCIVAEAEGVLLICRRSEEQSIKTFTGEASERYNKKYD